MNTQYNLFATTPKGLELLLLDELQVLGAKDATLKLAGVAFTGDIEMAYRACLWSRLANRILLNLTSFDAFDEEALYQGVKTIQWHEHLNAHGTLAVNFVTTQSNITHTLYGAQKVKDAIVDQFREKYGERPNVDRETPDINVYVYLNKNKATISLDLSGESLHKRGYRLSQGHAPLKENLAAAILLRAGFPDIAKKGGSLLDPMCGSGTLLIEAALMAGDIAPGLNRDYFGFLGWRKHNKSVWEKLLTDAKHKAQLGFQNIPTIIGYDQDPLAIKNAFENIERAGLLGKIHVEKKELTEFSSRTNLKEGLVVVNPPYGERLGEIEELKTLYHLLGDKLKQAFSNWKAAVFTGNPELGKVMGLRSYKIYQLFNGALPCQLLLFKVEKEYFVDKSAASENARRIKAAKRLPVDGDIQMFINRLRKNFKHLNRKAQKENKTGFRVYDADIPEYAFAIDIFPDKVEVMEYQAPKFINPKIVQQRQNAVLAALPELLDRSPKEIFFKIVARTKKD